jgi:hypothetical protein
LLLTRSRLGGESADASRFSHLLTEALPSLYPALPAALPALSTIDLDRQSKKGKDMASRNATVGTGVAVAGLAGLGVAAVTLGAPESATPLQPAADTVETQTQVVNTVEHRTKRLKAHKRHGGRTVIRAADDSSGPGPGTRTATTSTSARHSDDGPSHDLNDDRGGRGEIEAGDDHGGRGENEAGDDHGGRGENEAGDDHGGDSANRGPGGGDDDHESQDD